MDKLFVIRKRTPQGVRAFFNGWLFRPASRPFGPVRPHEPAVKASWTVKWDEGHASIITTEDVEQVKKDLWERSRLAENIDYDRVQVG